MRTCSGQERFARYLQEVATILCVAAFSVAAFSVAVVGVAGADELQIPAAADSTVVETPEEGAVEQKTADEGATTRAVMQRPADSSLAEQLQVYIDPETGKMIVPPAKGRRQVPSDLRERLSTSHDGLKVVETPFGYSYVDLEGRFLNATSVTVGPDGSVKYQHGMPIEPEAARLGVEQIETAQPGTGAISAKDGVPAEEVAQ